MKATLPSSFPATYVTPFTTANAVLTVACREAWSGTETGQRILVAGPVRSAANGDRHRSVPVRMITERPGRGGPGYRRERVLAMPLDTLRVGAVQRQPGEELGRHAPAAAPVVVRT